MKGMATYSSILAWRILWTEDPGELESMGSQRIGHTHTHTHTHILYIYIYVSPREGDVTPLQYSCLENHMNEGAW